MKIMNAFVCVCGRQKPEDPQLSPIADDAITRGGLGGLVSLVNICDPIAIFLFKKSILFLQERKFIGGSMQISTRIAERLGKGECDKVTLE